MAAWHPFQDWRRHAGTTRTNKFENPKLHKTSPDLRGSVQARVTHNTARRVRDRMQPLFVLPSELATMKCSALRCHSPLLSFCLIPVLASCSGSARVIPDADGDEEAIGTALVEVDPAQRLQAIEGFGASVAWYGELFTEHPNRAALAQLLFADLGIDILRLRNQYRKAGDVPDANGVAIVQAATESLGHPPRTLLTSWAPPASLKASGIANCSGDSDTGCTLRKNTDGSFPYDEFARYWVESIQAYRTEGLDPYYVSIQNEPDFVPNGWEGCRFDPIEQNGFPGYDRALDAVATQFSSAAIPTRLIGPDSAHLLNGAVLKYVEAAKPGQLYGIAHHLYDGNSWKNPDGFYVPMADIAQTFPELPKFQTEFSPTDQAGKAVQGGFEVAWLIHHSIAIEHASAYLHWELFWPTSGLVAIDNPHDPSRWTSANGYTIREPYYAMRHFSRYTDPGDRVLKTSVDATDVLATAFLAPDGSRLTVVVLNTSNAQRSFSLKLGGFAYVASKSFTTTSDVPWQPGAEFAPESDPTEVALPPRSVMTIAFANDPALLR